MKLAPTRNYRNLSYAIGSMNHPSIRLARLPPGFNAALEKDDAAQADRRFMAPSAIEQSQRRVTGGRC